MIPFAGMTARETEARSDMSEERTDDGGPVEGDFERKIESALKRSRKPVGLHRHV